jgi:hypothetical protein
MTTSLTTDRTGIDDKTFRGIVNVMVLDEKCELNLFLENMSTKVLKKNIKYEGNEQ